MHGAVLPELKPEHTLGPGVEEMPMEALTKTPMKPTSAMKDHLAAVKSRTKLAVRPHLPTCPSPTNHTGQEERASPRGATAAALAPPARNPLDPSPRTLDLSTACSAARGRRRSRSAGAARGRARR